MPLSRQEDAMFTKSDAHDYKELLDGVRLKTMAHGERTLLGEFRLRKGAVVPIHHHLHEQTGYLVSGRLGFVIEGEHLQAEAGDAWCIPSNVEHGAEALEDSVVVEVFSPVREDYLP
jgi:quercetin dioxygenase-like cupin family protein